MKVLLFQFTIQYSAVPEYIFGFLVFESMQLILLLFSLKQNGEKGFFYLSSIAPTSFFIWLGKNTILIRIFK